MTIETLTVFFKWCSILNLAILYLSWLGLWLCPDFIYRIHSRWFSVSREAFNNICYAYLGVFKILVIVFSLVPYLALLIIG